MTFNKKNETYLEWVNNPNLDHEMRDLLNKATDEELESDFGLELVFGTAGIRGIMGPGPGRFNIYTIEKVTIGYAKLLKKKYPKELNRGVVIGHDNRHNSKRFAQVVADVLSSYGIVAYLFKDNEMQPTPVVSFATRAANALGGVVITASHNPAQYNGYKIYDETGSQLMPADTDYIAKEIDEVKDIFDEVFEPTKNLIKTVDKKIIEEYEAMINNLQFYPGEKKHDLKIVYSAVNGTGSLYTPKILRKEGYEVHEVAEHAFEDETFKNVGNPNPEFDPAWKLPLRDAQKEKADIIIINDPDADRIGVAVLHQGEYVRLTGNEVGALLVEWKLSQMKKNGTLPKNPALYSSFVTSNLADRIAEEKYGVKVIKTLTGFKWMGDQINKEKERGLNFVFAYEESIGYVIDNSTRDKDGIQAAIMMAEAAWYLKDQKHEDLIDELHHIYDEFGAYYGDTLNLNFTPEEKDSKIAPIMKQLREHGLEKLGDMKVVKKEDYLHGLYNMPGQDLMKFYFEDGSWFAIRPSGTEPKLKIYFIAVAKTYQEAKAKADLMEKNLLKDLHIDFKK